MTPFLDNTDDQAITAFSLDDATGILTLTLEDGGTQNVNFSTILAAADNQALTLETGNILTLVDGGTVDLTPFLDNTETLVTAGNDISIAGDGSIATPYIVANTRPNIFYPPSIAIDASAIVNNVTVDLYQQYLDQYDGSASNFTASAGAPATVPFYGPTDLYYYVTFADPAVLNIDSINASGVLQYDVVGTPPDYNSLINVVFVVK